MLTVSKGIKRIGSKELVEIALHVLVAWNEGSEPAPGDIGMLKNAFPSSAHLPVDELACQVIHDLSGRILPEPERERKGTQQIKDDVA